MIFEIPNDHHHDHTFSSKPSPSLIIHAKGLLAEDVEDEKEYYSYNCIHNNHCHNHHDPEMQKAASMASALVLIFSPAVLIFGLLTGKICLV